MWFNDDQNLYPVQHTEEETKRWGLSENREQAKPKLDSNHSMHGTENQFWNIYKTQLMKAFL